VYDPSRVRLFAWPVCRGCRLCPCNVWVWRLVCVGVRVGSADPRVGDFIPFRDAAFGLCTYTLTILDCLRGVRRAMACGLFNFATYVCINACGCCWAGVRG
jgi:hypothetical protein